MTNELLDPLNPEQRGAVTSEAPRTLVLAGAGSGKTRVLVHRVGWLIQQRLALPHNILAVTFTNKAAGEMRSRIEELLDQPAQEMWVGTFHGLSHRLLRRHWDAARLPQNFQILDSDDQFRAIKRIMKTLQIDDSRWPPRSIQSFINARKDEGLRSNHIDPRNDPFLTMMISVYREYERHCEKSGLVDFAELMLRSHELLRDNPEVAAHYHQRFKHILVDEFQDTNALQYAWLQLLAGHNNAQLFIVGDDDQSTYGWRGARIENMQEFINGDPPGEIIRLEQNYRSTTTILNAANSLIANNQERLGKNLWSAGEKGSLIRLYRAFNETDEARFAVSQVKAWIAQGRRASDIAILYRSNAQSRLFEEILVAEGIPYRVYGGQRFFERAEIKDALAYLRLMANPADDGAFERVVNHPPRGIGARTMAQLRVEARRLDQSLHATALTLCEFGTLTGRARNALQGFITLLQQLGEGVSTTTLEEKIERVLSLSGLIEHFSAERSDKAEARVENLRELVSPARTFEETNSGEGDPLSEFLANAALESGETQAVAGADSLQIMTLHSAKGLEFHQVYMVGVEEGLFPHQRSVEEPARLEEERRLCYVGMTRARSQLYITHAESRRLYGETLFPRPSRFIGEIPEQHLEEVRLGGEAQRPGRSRGESSAGSKPWGGSRSGFTPPVGSAVTTTKPRVNMPSSMQNQGAYRAGQPVRHKKFGEGTVLAVEGDGDKAKIQINFKRFGKKWLIAGFANLETSA